MLWGALTETRIVQTFRSKVFCHLLLSELINWHNIWAYNKNRAVFSFTTVFNFGRLLHLCFPLEISWRRLASLPVCSKLTRLCHGFSVWHWASHIWYIHTHPDFGTVLWCSSIIFEVGYYFFRELCCVVLSGQNQLIWN